MYVYVCIYVHCVYVYVCIYIHYVGKLNIFILFQKLHYIIILHFPFQMKLN